ncbi:hypothetical protein HAX54_009853, partial [Datura stramonium]|nr:hypothetical protein [Datura stramonium]
DIRVESNKNSEGVSGGDGAEESGCSPATVAVGENKDEEKEGVTATVVFPGRYGAVREIRWLPVWCCSGEGRREVVAGKWRGREGSAALLSEEGYRWFLEYGS